MRNRDRPLILASASPRRRELLAELELGFEVRAAAVDEIPQPGETPEALVCRLSREKAVAVAEQVPPGAIVLAADTTVVLDGENLGKPTTPDEAREMLSRLRGRAHTVMTAIAVYDTARDLLVTDLATTRVTMRDYTDEEIAAYVASGDPFDKAGGYAIQHAGFHPVAVIDGSYTNVVGLPLEHVVRALREIGVIEGPRGNS
jgi:MAF protein